MRLWLHLGVAIAAANCAKCDRVCRNAALSGFSTARAKVANQFQWGSVQIVSLCKANNSDVSKNACEMQLKPFN